MTSTLTTLFQQRSAIGAALALAFTCQAQAAQYSVQFLEMGAYQSVTANDLNNVGQIVGSGRLAGVDGAQAVLWNGTAITTLSSSGRYSSAHAINDHGVVAGAVGGLHDDEIAATWNAAGQRTDIGAPHGYSQGLTINNAGQVGGFEAAEQFSAGRATIWNGSTPTSVGGALASSAYAINGIGQLAGAEHGARSSQATVWSGDQKTTLAGLGGTYSYAYAINDAGVIAGMSTLAGNAHYRAVTWDANGTLTLLQTPDGYDSDVRQINKHGQVLGFISRYSVETDLDETRIVIWDGDTLIDLSASLDAQTISEGWQLVDASGFNDAGWVVGRLRLGTSNVFRSALLTPVPEPEALVMMLAGVGLVGLVGWRRRRATAA
ncbi:MAG: PEP-CTERM sorting domain-containing protein [Rubrivivax sp.]|nr:MAG: PEP-CTERM sorting domain-containing protein [Rubrivivax sp.]